MTQKNIAEKSTVFQDLLAIQKELKTIAKDKSAFKGKYATIEKVWETIRHTINDHNFVVTHTSDEKGIYTYALHISGEKLQSFIPWSGNHDPQEQGKELTYAHRYGINAIFNVIIADEDNDANKTQGNYKKKEVDGELAAKKLLKAKSHDEATAIYKSLSKEEKVTAEVIMAVEEMREKYKD